MNRAWFYVHGDSVDVLEMTKEAVQTLAGGDGAAAAVSGVAEGATEIVRELEEMASRPEIKRPRHVSEREAEWLGRLIEKHGDDTGAMARDLRLNPMQQTARDIARRIRKMRGE